MTNDDSSPLLVLMVIAGDKLVNTVLYSYLFSDEPDLKVVCIGQSQKWDATVDGDFQQAVRKSFQHCLENTDISENQISKLIFLVSPFWTISSEKIIDSKQELLKKICKDFRLKPSGFIVDDEAMIHHFSSNGESLPSFILVFFAKNELRISIVHLGKIKGRVKLDIQDRLTAEQIKEGLSRLDFDGVMPPQICVWGEIDNDLKEELNNYSWMEKGDDLFLHLPEVTVFSWPDAASAYSKIISSRLAKESDNLLSNRADNEKEVGSDDSQPVIEPEPEKLGEIPFGFSEDDISKQEVDSKNEQSLISDNLPIADKKEEIYESSDVNPSDQLASERKSVSFGIFSKLKKIKIKKPHLNSKKLKTKTVVVIAIPVVAFACFILFFLKTTIDIYATPQQVEEMLVVSLEEGGSLSVTKKTIPARSIETEKQEVGSVVATGNKLIGEKATGKVTIYNRTDSQAVFEKGTVVASLGGLEFLLQEEVKVASKTPDLASGVDRWGEMEASLIASQIGSDYNLAKDTSFTIDDQPESLYLVKNKQEFSGGTSREILAVSDDDYDSLKKELVSKLEEEVKYDLLSQTTGDVLVVEETLSVDTVSFNTDSEIGEESDTLQGTMKVRASVLVFSRSNLAVFADEVLKKKLDSGLKIDPDSFSFNFDPRQSEEGVWIGDFEIKARAYPNIDTDGLRESIKGKTKRVASEKLKVFPRVYRFQIGSQPSFLRLWPLISFSSKNILISIED
jgi:hypothetical protein